jgi:hypothetical protein
VPQLLAKSHPELFAKRSSVEVTIDESAQSGAYRTVVIAQNGNMIEHTSHETASSSSSSTSTSSADGNAAATDSKFVPDFVQTSLYYASPPPYLSSSLSSLFMPPARAVLPLTATPDGLNWMLQLQVGTPPVTVSLIVDTGSAETVLI